MAYGFTDAPPPLLELPALYLCWLTRGSRATYCACSVRIAVSTAPSQRVKACRGGVGVRR